MIVSLLLRRLFRISPVLAVFQARNLRYSIGEEVLQTPKNYLSYIPPLLFFILRLLLCPLPHLVEVLRAERAGSVSKDFELLALAGCELMEELPMELEL